MNSFCIKRERYPFPFHRIQPSGAHIIIWGYGNIGKSYYEQATEIDYCIVDAIVDKNADQKVECPVHLHYPEYLKDCKTFDYLVIAVYDDTIATQIQEECKEYGIPSAKIVRDIIVKTENVSFPYGIIEDVFSEELYRLLAIHHVKEKSLIRVGNRHDGGYIMLDDFGKGKVAYSFGISDDVSWDEAMANFGYDVFMYDHTINGLPKNHKRFHFFQKGIAAEVRSTECLSTLESYIKENGHETLSHMILKMDVEGAEWGFLDTVSSDDLARFDQIVMEIHGVLTNDWRRTLCGLKKINQTHNVVHIHANNYSPIEAQNEYLHLSDSLEVTWVLKSNYNFEKKIVNLPLSIDSPCNPSIPDIQIGKWYIE